MDSPEEEHGTKKPNPTNQSLLEKVKTGTAKFTKSGLLQGDRLIGWVFGRNVEVRTLITILYCVR